MVIWFFSSFSVNTANYINFHILYYHSIPERNTSWISCIILFFLAIFPLSIILLKMFASVFMRNISVYSILIISHFKYQR